ncbi:MAG TPA: hypothetical protein VNG33_21255 [Polyangiaceae bacterium]|nr:hypothetical protein [Polyangiaceae bacterium]
MLRLCALLLLPGLAACSSLSNCPKGEEPRIITTGKTYTDPSLFYESAPLWGPLDAFPAQTELVFVHNLGVTPEAPESMLSFSKDGIVGGELTPNAGNQGEITCVDDKVIVIKNGTCEKDFYIRVTAAATGNTTGAPACELDPK